MYRTLDHNTWTAADDDTWLLCGKLFLHDTLHLCKIVRINNCDTIESKCCTERFEIHLTGRFAAQVLTGCRILLMSGHTCDRIIQYNHSRITHIVSDIRNTCNTGMDKGRITDYTDTHLLALFAHRFIKAMQAGARRTHADI